MTKSSHTHTRQGNKGNRPTSFIHPSTHRHGPPSRQSLPTAVTPVRPVSLSGWTEFNDMHAHSSQFVDLFVCVTTFLVSAFILSLAFLSVPYTPLISVSGVSSSIFPAQYALLCVCTDTEVLERTSRQVFIKFHLV